MSNQTITFGKHKGTPVSQVPVDYLIWMLEEFKESTKVSWLMVAYEELVRRKVLERVAAGKNVVVSMPDLDFYLILVPPAVKNNVRVRNLSLYQTLLNFPNLLLNVTDIDEGNGVLQAPHRSEVDWTSEEDKQRMLVSYARSGRPIVIPTDSREQLKAELPYDLQLIDSNMGLAASSLAAEVALYGHKENQTCPSNTPTREIQLLYLGLRWLFSLSDGPSPHLRRIERTSS